MSVKSILLALLAFAIFATHDVFIKLLGGSFSPFQVVFFSTLFSFPLVALLLMRDPKSGTLRPVNVGWIAARTLSSVVTALSAFYAFSVLPLAQTYALLFAAPLLITLLSIPVLGEPVGWRRMVAVVVGLCGVLIVLRPGATEFTLGHAAALLSAVGNSVSSVILRRIGRDERPVVLMVYPMVAIFVLMGAMLPTVYRPMEIEHLGMIAIVSLFGFVAGLLLIAAYNAGEAAIVAPMQYSQIIWASFFGVVIFDDSIDVPTLVGAAVIIVSGLYIVFRESRGGASRTTPVLRTRSRGISPGTPRISAFLKR
ncbi:DMT family transporter [Aliiroseovarius sp. PTFE2010]|uniref:DMT family transporter n=1 Tax=Aliiroseovarius sp. PTFE2010 TaxID=3417190 RepID=UPI003CEC9A55